MEEKDLIKQLKALKSIKPNKDWAALTKGEILRFAQNDRMGFQNDRMGLRTSWIFASLGRPAFVLSTLAVVALVLVGGFFYFTTQENNVAYETLEGLLAKLVSDASLNKNSQEMLSSLDELQAKLADVTTAVDNLKHAKDQGQALAITEIVKTTANEGKEVMQRIKGVDGGLSKQVLASLVEVELRADELGQKSYSLQKEILRDYLNDLKQRALSEQDQERLKRAEELYSQGREAEALILVTRIGSR